MEIVFLGCGTSQGVPLIAHDNKGLDLSNPRNWRNRSSVHVVMDGWRVQVDAPPEFRVQCLELGIEKIDTFILTHGHADHILGMDDLRRFCQLLPEERMPVYSTPEGMQRIAAIYPYALQPKAVRRGYICFDLAEMPERLEVPGGVIESTLLPHDPLETLGLVFTEKSSGRRFVYFNDCKAVSPVQRELARGADVVVLDALRPREHVSHMSIQEALETAAAIGGKQTYFTHMTQEIDYETWSRKLPEDVYLAWDGLRLTV